MSRRTIVLAGTVVAGAVLLVLLLHGANDTSTQRAEPRHTAGVKAAAEHVHPEARAQRPPQAPLLRGTVVRADNGAPIPGTPVRIYVLKGDWRLVAEVTSDRRGEFTVDGLTPGGRFFVFDTHKGDLWFYGGKSSAFRFDPARRLIVELMPAGTVTGTVLSPDGQPVAGARIRYSASSRRSATTVSGADGRFEVHGLMGLADMAAVADGFGRSAPWRGSIQPGHRSRTRIKLRLRPMRPVAGVVRTSDGRPIGGAYVNLGIEARGYRTRTDAAGRFSLREVPAGTSLWLQVANDLTTSQNTPGRISWYGPDLRFVPFKHEYGPDADLEALEIRLIRPARILGVVHDAAGGPMPYGTVVAERLDEPSNDVVAAVRRITSGGTAPRGLADAKGEFEMSGLAPGQYALAAGALPTWLPHALRTEATIREMTRLVRLGEGGEARVDLDGSRWAVLRGRVVRPRTRLSGSARGGMRRITVEPLDIEHYRFARESFSVVGDTFTVSVWRAAFPYLLRYRLGSTDLCKPVNLPAPSHGEIILHEPEQRLGGILVRVHDRAGRPVRKFEVLLDGEAEGARWDLGRTFGNAPEGAHWDDLVPGTYRLRINAPGYRLATVGFVEIPPGGEIEENAVLEDAE